MNIKYFGGGMWKFEIIWNGELFFGFIGEIGLWILCFKVKLECFL